uniref:F-box protein AT5G49610-like beta-propeller domain-containing protein n=1 Tax=Hordeum vulgare subsp. vulgare TaxID=112509 RepID=A0A8I6Y1G5_HORVV
MSMTVLSGLNLTISQGSMYIWTQLFSKQEEDGWSCFYLIVKDVMDAPGGALLSVYMLQNCDDVWRLHVHLTLASDLYPQLIPKGVLVDNKIYLATENAIVVLDLTSSIASTIQPPHGVSIDLGKTTMLSRADDGSVLCLIHINELQLQIWLHNGDNWSLLDTICLSEMCANMLEDVPTADIRINHVGDYNDFVFLEMGRCVLYLDVKSRTLRKGYEMTADEYHLGDIYPFMMSWPPIFPTLSPARPF